MSSSNAADSKRGARLEHRPIVWILDDSPMELAMAKRALVSHFDVETFSEGAALLERFAVGSGPTVLVLDLQLPGMSGIEVCRFLRSQKDETSLPILMLTVYGHKSDLVEGLEAGANDYVTKPYDAPELLARVATLSRIKTLFEAARSAEVERAELFERERDARRQAEAANQAKDDFLAIVSHELRTPLNAILGWTRMLRAGSVPEEQRARALATVERNAVAQTQLIDDLLDMSRILSGKLNVTREVMDLVHVVHTSIDAVRPAAESKGVRLHADVHPEAGRVSGDAGRLQQVVWNLLTNAIKFTGKGGRVELSVAPFDRYVEIRVTDTGRGIDPSFLPHVFERFRQGDDRPKRAEGGLGLGLAIVRHIVDLHGGTVSAESDGPGSGATLRVRLPRVVERAYAESPLRGLLGDPDLHNTDSHRLFGMHVLVVDDDVDTLELLAAVLRQAGAKVTAENNAESAFLRVVETRPDVVVSDVGMPEQDGYEFIRRVRHLAPEAGGKTPGLAVTAFARSDDRDRALSAGFTMYLSKPIEPTTLVARVAELAGRNV